MATKIDSPFRSREQREADREAKREAVLLAAVRMFNERGFQATTFDDVAASLGVSKPTIYHYLGNKEDVLLECLTRGINELKDAAAHASEVEGTGLDRLKAYLERFAMNAMEDFGRCVIRTYENSMSPDGAERFRGLKREVDASLRALIQDAMADGSIAKGDVRLVAFTLADALNGPARWYRPDPGHDPKELAAQIVDLLLAGVRKGIPS